MIIWLIGLSGAGKSTIANLLYNDLKLRHSNLVYLDGDNLRDVWGDQLGHTVDARNKNAHRISHLCQLMDQQEIHAIAAVLSIFPDWQRWNRENFRSYFEIFLDTPMDVLKARDSKGLYASAARGKTDNVVGVDIPFPRPANADLTISGDAVMEKPSVIAERILRVLPHPLKTLT